jgi:hypothetical protein
VRVGAPGARPGGRGRRRLSCFYIQ